MKFIPQSTNGDPRGKGNPLEIHARFLVTEEQSKQFQIILGKLNIKMNQLVKQMVIHCLENADMKGKKK